MNTESLDNFHDCYYYGLLNIEKDKQTYNVIFDTGSDVTWIISEECAECNNKHKYIDD